MAALAEGNLLPRPGGGGHHSASQLAAPLILPPAAPRSVCHQEALPLNASYVLTRGHFSQSMQTKSIFVGHGQTEGRMQGAGTAEGILWTSLADKP